jgi:hypothetical protein
MASGTPLIAPPEAAPTSVIVDRRDEYRCECDRGLPDKNAPAPHATNTNSAPPQSTAHDPRLVS